MLIIGLGLWWIFAEKGSHIPFSFQALIPEFRLESMVLFSGILLSLVGVEVAAYHIRDAKHPQKDYPKALLVASFFILAISILGTLAIAMVVPQKDISLLSGLIQAFTVFFKNFNMEWAVPLLALLALIGSLAGINTWIVGPAKGLMVTAEDGFLSPFFAKMNEKEAPVGMLLFQATIGSILSLIFLWMDSHSSAYWVLTALSAQFAVVQYGFVFAAAIKLRYSQPNVERAYRVPGGKFGIWLVSGIGILACLFGFLIVFVPPEQLETGDKAIYQATLAFSFIVLSLIPVLLAAKKRFRRKVHNKDLHHVKSNAARGSKS